MLLAPPGKAGRIDSRHARRHLVILTRTASDPAPEADQPHRSSAAASGYVCPADDAAEPFAVGVVVVPNDVPADHVGLFFVAGMIGTVEREVAQRGELRLDAVNRDAFDGVWAISTLDVLAVLVAESKLGRRAR
jgi:hypothetical protein